MSGSVLAGHHIISTNIAANNEASVGRAPARQRKLAAGFNCCVPLRL
jgi:hypothetical protein